MFRKHKHVFEDTSLSGGKDYQFAPYPPTQSSAVVDFNDKEMFC